MIPFSPPRIDQEVINEVVEALKSGWITTGPRTKKFEKELATYAGVEKVLCLNSATAGLELMLRWWGVTEGDEVILPAYTYTATANVVIHCGATPVLVDVNTEDFNINIAKVRSAVTAKTKAIIPVDIGGFPCDYHTLNDLVNEIELKKKFIPASANQQKLGRILVLSDAAHSLGAIYNNKKTGALADATVFSFHAVKNLTTAEGGAVCLNFPLPFNNEEIYNALCIKSLHGQNKDALAKTQKGNWEYDIVEAGYKWNMPDILAAIGIVELSRYDNDTLIRRKEIVTQYENAFSKMKWAQLPPLKNDYAETSYHLYLLRVKNITERQRNQIIQHLFAKEVSVNVHFKPLPLLSFYKSLGYKMGDYPVSYDNYAREISLPVYYNLSDNDVKIIIQAVKDSVEEVIGK